MIDLSEIRYRLENGCGAAHCSRSHRGNVTRHGHCSCLLVLRDACAEMADELETERKKHAGTDPAQGAVMR